MRPASLDLGRRLAGARVAHRFAVHLPPDGDTAGEVTGTLVRGRERCARNQRRASVNADRTSYSTACCPAPRGTSTGALVVRAQGAGETVVPLRVQVVEPPVPRQAPEGP